jgi:hypothetical protein|tara:strand:- start:326 stop:646 length:321 start_codon:yes stop_codon:yes gene_type:complete
VLYYLVTQLFYFGGKMSFKPFNRFVRVLPLEDDVGEYESPIILMPEDFKRPIEPHMVCEVISKADDVVLKIEVGEAVVIERRMLLEVKTGDEVVFLILENYIYGRI